MVCGASRVYPASGDNPLSWCPQNYNGQEHIELKYDQLVMLQEVHLYETMATGPVTCIKAKREAGSWYKVWEGRGQQNEAARIFAPNITPPPEPISILRIEINCTGWNNWYELDAVKIKGTVADLTKKYERPHRGSLAGDLLALHESNSGDMEFVTPRGDVLKAHSFLLKYRCTAFSSLTIPVLEPQMVPFPREITLLVLQFLYTDSVDLAPEYTAAMVPAADFFGLPKLREIAVSRFARSLNKNNVVPALKVVEKFPDLAKVCLDFISFHIDMLYEESTQLASLASLSSTQLLTVLSQVVKTQKDLAAKEKKG
eukprot:m.29683 g.29683  ORF g.29683 m.29683 type:complete len:314 (+) comp14395_c0_seq2:504-1445(+)